MIHSKLLIEVDKIHVNFFDIDKDLLFFVKCLQASIFMSTTSKHLKIDNDIYMLKMTCISSLNISCIK